MKDIPFAVLIILFFLIWLIIGLLSFLSAHPKSLMAPKDSFGGRCGVDPHVKDKPNLFLFDILECDDPATPFTGCNTLGVCVKDCPVETFFSPGKAENRDITYCFYDTPEWNETVCPKWYLPSYSKNGRCLPETIDQETLNDINQFRKKNATMKKFWSAVRSFELLIQIRHFGQSSVNQIVEWWWVPIIVCSVVLLSSVLYVRITKFCPGVTIWTTICLVHIIIIFSLYFCVSKYIILRNEYYSSSDEQFLSYFRIKKNIWLTCIVITSIITGVFVIVFILMRGSISRCISVVQISAETLKSHDELYLITMSTSLFRILVLFYAIATEICANCSGVAVYYFEDMTEECKTLLGMETETRRCDFGIFKTLVSNASHCDGTRCSFSHLERPFNSVFIRGSNLVITIWLLSFVHGMGEAIFAATLSGWYKDSTIEIRRAVKVIIPNYLGTVAVGSSLIALYRNYFFKAVMTFLNVQRGRVRGTVGSCGFTLIVGTLGKTESFAVCVSSYAYIYCPLKEHSFLKGTRKVVRLILSTDKFVNPNIEYIMVMGQIAITCAAGLITYRLLNHGTDVFHEHAGYSSILSIFAMCCSFLIATPIFDMFRMTNDTMFICLLQEYDEHVGNQSEMSQNHEKVISMFQL